MPTKFLPTVKVEEIGESASEISQPPQDKGSASGERGSELNDFDFKISKNETKNIPKNYGKAIIIFIEKNREALEKIIVENGHNYDQLIEKLARFKKTINTISDLRTLWEE